jgi:hypothetical protein
MVRSEIPLSSRMLANFLASIFFQGMAYLLMTGRSARAARRPGGQR